VEDRRLPHTHRPGRHVLNPDKFQFAEKSVDFAGFRVSDTTIEPLPKYLDAIRDFPTPDSTTDIRSWFGLVNQVTNYAQLRDTMAPFKPFLSPRCKFSWSPELEEAFQTSKQAIVEAIREGVEYMTYRSAPASALTGPGVVLVTFYSNNTVAAPLAYQTVAREDGGSPSLAHVSYLLQSSAMQPSKEKPWLWPGALSKHDTSRKDATTSS
jgi:hypothetical protein